MNESLVVLVSKWITPFVFFLAYLIGSVPFGLLVRRMSLKTWPSRLITVSLDFGKGILAVILGTSMGLQAIAGIVGVPSLAEEAGSALLPWGCAFFAVLGHCKSLFLKFQGGKGVATTFGAMMLISPVSAAAGLVGYGLAFFHRGIVSLASIAGLLVMAGTYLVLNPVGVHLWIGLVILLFVLVRHEPNMDALLNGTEKPLRS